MLISRTQGTRPGRNTGRAAGFQGSERRLASQPVRTEHIRVHERAGHGRCITSVLISSPLEPNFSPSRGSSRARLLLRKPTQQPNLTSLNSLVVSTQSATSTSKQTCRPRPDRRPPQFSLSGALLCGCGASKHTDQRPAPDESRGNIHFRRRARLGRQYRTSTAPAR